MSNQLYPSYGNYWQQQPMKVFAGQPNWATQTEVAHLQKQVNDLEKSMDSQYNLKDGNNKACKRCPKSLGECNSLSTKNSREECVSMFKVCKHNC